MTRRVRRDEGFTLVELMVTMLVLGILAAIALPMLSKQKSKAQLSSIKASLRDAAGAQELWSSENGGYTADLADLQAVGYRTTDGIDLNIAVSSASYCIEASHPPSGQRLYFSNSGAAAGRPSAAAC